VRRAWNHSEWFAGLDVAEAIQGGVEGPRNPPLGARQHRAAMRVLRLSPKSQLWAAGSSRSGEGGKLRRGPAAAVARVNVVLKYVMFSSCAKMKRISCRALYLTLKGLSGCTSCVP